MGSMVYAYPPHVRKFEIIGGLFGEPYRLARCGVGDLEVPAGAEIVIEGEILAEVQEPEGPFSEFTGYASYRSTQNVFVAHRVRMRRDAMFQSVTSGMSRITSWSRASRVRARFSTRCGATCRTCAPCTSRIRRAAHSWPISR